MPPKPTQPKAKRLTSRDQKSRILIVGEGKTEVLYFQGLCEYYELSQDNIDIQCCENNASAPINVVGKAQEIKSKIGKEKAFDEIYCVFDKDEHSTYGDAITLAKDLKFTVINSDPCIEYWFLLHHVETSKPYAKIGNKSVGETVVQDLKRYWKNYEKTNDNLFEHSLNASDCTGDKALVDYAIPRSIKRSKQIEGSNETNPSTNFHVLVEKLLSMKK
jgi:hypothetical protein